MAASLSPLPIDQPAPVGVFDSGLGGLSVLSVLRHTLPDHPLLYLADSGHAPYGERSDEFVIDRTLAIGRHLLASGAELLVVACNTATAVAVTALRERWPGVPVVGVEPAIKPAVKASAARRIGVMATPATLRSARFQQLLDAHGGGATIVQQPCPGLAGQIERGDLDAPELITMVESFCAPLRAANVDTVVLGCTHYPFVRRHIEAAMGPAVELLDTAWPVSRQAARLLGVRDSGTESTATVRLETTGDVTHLQSVAARWLDFPVDSVTSAAI